MDSLDDVLLDVEDKMKKSVSVLTDSFSGIRTGKASPALVDSLQVPYYGTPTRLKELAGISTPEPRLIVISPFDPTVLSEIEKTILSANLGVTPVSDGRVVRVPIPELSEDRRKEMVKVAKRTAEEARVAIRNVRRDANDQVKSLQKDGKIAEDDRDQAMKKIQESTDSHVGKVDELLKSKEQEIMEV